MLRGGEFRFRYRDWLKRRGKDLRKEMGSSEKMKRGKSYGSSSKIIVKNLPKIWDKIKLVGAFIGIVIYLIIQFNSKLSAIV